MAESGASSTGRMAGTMRPGPLHGLLMPTRIRPAMLGIATLSLCALAIVGCATVPPSERNPRDPWQRMNRGVFKFNDVFDRAIATPVARTYVRVFPQAI